MEIETKKDKGSLPEWVAQLYYSYALFCSSHPILLISLALACFLSCCYPLLNIPPGSTPKRITLPCAPCGPQTTYSRIQTGLDPSGVTDFTNNIGDSLCSTLCINVSSGDLHSTTSATTPNFPQPLLYVHQLILNTGVWPWTEELKAEDAYRVPLQEVFRLLDIIRNHQEPVTGTSLGNVCYHVESVSVRRRWTQRYTSSQDPSDDSGVLPEYNCLMLSPANLWHQDVDKFSLDPDPLETIFMHQSLQKGKVSTAEMVFGMHLKETGIKRYPLRARTRMLQYAVTLFYNQLNVGYVRSLNEKLLTVYPESMSPSALEMEATLIHYPPDLYYYEYVPVFGAFIGLFFYIYFSVRKIEFIKSKVGLSFSAVFSIAAGLMMSKGICFFFGLTLSFRGKEIYPYLVILVGLENVFVLTKSVMSTDSQLDVKIRLAQGLSKEGWSITKNILTEITILTVCLFTFIPVIQQFSIFMIVSLFSDYFLQMCFFTTVLGIDIKRKELSRDRPSTLQFYGLNKFAQLDLGKHYNKNYCETSGQRMREKSLPRSKSQPRLNGSFSYSYSNPALSSSLLQRSSHIEQRRSKIEPNQNPQGHVPKRIRLVNVWARTRFFQRAFMIWMVVWVSMIIYSSGVVDDLLIVHHNTNSTVGSHWKANDGSSSAPSIEKSQLCNSSINCSGVWTIRSGSSPAPRHWAALLDHYNVSCAGLHLAVAPPLLLRHHVPPDVAIAARPSPPLHPHPPLRWRAFAAALDPLDFSDAVKEKGRWIWKRAGSGNEEDQPFYPTSLMEIFLLAMLCIISVLFISYMMVVLYRCVCTRNYAEWRATWISSGDAISDPNNHTPQIIMEAVPIIVAGHSQEVECLATDGERVVSCCLQGTIKVWDPSTGDLLTNINRTMFFELQNEVLSKLQADGVDEIEDIPQCNGSIDENQFPVYFSNKENSSVPLLGNFKFSSCQPTTTAASYALSSISGKSKTMYDFTLHHRLMMDRKLQREDRDGLESSNSESNSGRSSISEGITTNENREGYTSIWCMDVCGCWDLIVVGCANGRLECWAASTGRLECVVESIGGCGITHLQVVGEFILLGRLSGDLEKFQLYYITTTSTTSSALPSSNRGHIRTGSAGSILLKDAPSHPYNRFTHSHLHNNCSTTENVEQGCLQCAKIKSVRAHQQPFEALECDSRWVITGSLDHTVKVFHLEELTPIYTLHGHHGPIKCLFLDSLAPVCGSGSQEGLLCVWDLLTGACVYSVTAHDGPVTALNVTASYVISLGGDDRLCIWERFRGHLLNTVPLGGGAGGCGLLSLGPSLVVSGGRGGLTLWDASTATALRKVHLGHNDGCTFVRQILPLRDGIVCDYSNQLRIVRFPSVTKFLADQPSKCE